MLRGERFPGTNFKKPISRQVVPRVAKAEQQAEEERIMRQARHRDGRCRMPLCGCKLLQLRIDVCHRTHRGIGGNPKGDRTTLVGLITLCGARHRENQISLDRGTLKITGLTRAGWNGPCRWEVKWHRQWVEVGRETDIGIFEAFKPEQLELLRELREMTW